MPRTTSTTDTAPKPVGPYSHLAGHGGLVWVAGQGGFDLEGRLVSDDVRAQSEQAFINVDAILRSAGASSNDIVRIGVFLADLEDFAAFNEVYEGWLTAPYPARTTVQAGLAEGMRVEIEVVATVAP